MPAPRREAREEFSSSVTSPRTGKTLPLGILEALARALLSVLLAFLGAGVTADHAFRLELLAQFDVEQHQSAGDAQFDRIGLPIHPAARHPGKDIERARRLGRKQWLPGARALRLGDEILFKRTSVDFEIAAARTQIDARDCRLAPSRTVILH